MPASWSRRDEGPLVVLLAIDVRNTHTVIGLLSGTKEHAKVVQQWRIRTESEITADELALTLDGLIGDDSDQLTGASALSTVPSVLHEVRLMLEQYWPTVPHVLIEPGVRTGIPLLVDNPKEVGADRIVNCLAAFQKYNSAAIVIDFGSSICVDVVSDKGEFLGGAIAPGIQVSSDAAAARSAALRRVELARPRSVVGKNTVECMQAGAVFGFAGLVDGLVGRVREDVDGFSAGADNQVTVVATGHTAPLLLAELHSVDHYEPHLTLHGLRLVFERNRDSQRGRLKTAR
jgi:type III pantothenate kinase